MPTAKPQAESALSRPLKAAPRGLVVLCLLALILISGIRGYATELTASQLYADPDRFLEAIYDNPNAVLPQIQAWWRSTDPKKQPVESVHALLAYVDVLSALDKDDPIFSDPQFMRAALQTAREHMLTGPRIFLEMLLWINFDQTPDADPKTDEEHFEAWIKEAQAFDDLTTRLIINYSGQLMKNGAIAKALRVLQTEQARLNHQARVHPLRVAKFKARVSLVLYKAKNFEKSELVDAEIQALCDQHFYRKFCIETLGNVSVNYLRRKDPIEVRKVAELSQRIMRAARDIQLESEEAFAHYNMGLMHYILKEYPEALKSQQQALSIYLRLENREWIGAARLELANNYLELKDYPKLIQEAEKAKASFPDDFKSDRNTLDHLLYQGYRGLGDQKQALAALERYVEDYTKLRDEEKSAEYSRAMVDMGLKIEESRNQNLAKENALKEQQIEEQRRLKNLTLVVAIISLLLFILGISVVLLRRYAQKLIEHEKQRTTFFHNTSHELRTPLNGMIGFLDLIVAGRYGPIPENAQTQLQKVLRLAYSLKQQVNTILDLAKSQRGELALAPRSVDLEKLREDADQLAEGLCLKNPRLSYDSSLECLGDKAFIGDADKIFTIIRNLLGNAFKFTAPEQSNAVQLTLKLDAGTLHLSVTDQGIGIPQEFQDKIFKEFVQVQGDARRHYEGTGLGLTMVRDLVRLMKGTIALTSKPGEGTRVHVTLPSLFSIESLPVLQEGREERHDFFRQSTRAPTAILETKTSELGGLILVIDDNELNCELISDILRAEGYEVDASISGRSGLERMRSHRPELVLLDMMMPEMSGEDVLRVMQGDTDLQEIPVILITARASEEDRLFGLRLGAHDYLAKPLLPEELRLRVDTVMRHLRLTRQLSEIQAQEKMIHLGELFGDLSHEMKNLLQGTQYIPKLQLEDVHVCLAPLQIPEPYASRLPEAILNPERCLASAERLALVPHLQDTDDGAYQESLRALLAELQLSEGDLKELWRCLVAEGANARLFLEHQLRIWSNFRMLGLMTEKTRDLTLSILAYTKASVSAPEASVQRAWSHVERLVEARAHLAQVRWDLQLREAKVAIPEGPLMQVLINLALNAIDAVRVLPNDQRWIRLEAKTEDEAWCLRLSNGGAPIPLDLQARLFQRGFSTKGDAGNGIGLFVSRRLVHAAQGELRYDSKAASPCFELWLPCRTGKPRKEFLEQPVSA